MADGLSAADLSTLGISTDSYLGLTDTATSFSGSSTMQDVLLGSQIPLDTSVGPGLGPTGDYVNASVTDLLPQVPTSTYNPTAADLSQMLSGTSDTPPSDTAIAASTNTPNAMPSGDAAATALAGLSKFGASLAQIFGGGGTTVTQPNRRGAGSSNAPGYNPLFDPFAGVNAGGNSFTLIALIVFAALALLLMRSD